LHVFVVGLNHRTAPLWLRERVAFAPDSGAAPCVAARATVRESFVLSTCNRVEIYGAAPRAELAEAADRMLAVLAERAEVTLEALRAHAYVQLGDDAVRHLCRVAAGLDSLLVGETQIVGQVKRAVTDARRSGALGRVLQRLACTVLAASKRARAQVVRAESGPASVAELSVRAAGGSAALTGKSVVVIGAGETAADVLGAIALARPRRLLVVNRSAERAARLAARHRAETAPWARLGAEVAEADVVFACIATPEPVVTEAHFLDVPPRPRTILDLGVPRNVDPAVGTLTGTTLVDVDALALWRFAREDAPASSAAATEAAEATIGHWVARYRKWLRAQAVVVPTIAQLRADAERIRARELERALARLGDLSEREREVVRSLSARLVNKLLHAPLAALGAQPDAPALAESARLLFGLPPHPAAAAPDPADGAPPVAPHGDAAPRSAARV
jgi:glutamyl-tRNA reductase